MLAHAKKSAKSWEIATMTLTSIYTYKWKCKGMVWSILKNYLNKGSAGDRKVCVC